MFHDWNKAMREMRYVNAINMYGPSLTAIATRLGLRYDQYRAWLTYATYRWPIYEDDKGGIYIGEQK